MQGATDLTPLFFRQHVSFSLRSRTLGTQCQRAPATSTLDPLHLTRTILRLVAAEGDTEECHTTWWRHEVTYFTPGDILFTPPLLTVCFDANVPLTA